MKEAVNKRRLTAIAAAAAVILAIAGAMAYFSYANGGDGNEHVKAEIVETGIIPDGGADNGTLKRDILPGTSEQRDLTVRVDADTDVFVFLIVKDTVNTNDAGLVTYAIDPGWNVLDKTGLEEMNIEKSIDIFSDKASGTLTLAPQDANTKIYYRVEHGNTLSHSFTYPVLKDSQISYSSALTNDDVKNIQPDKDISFQTYAIQMQPFCGADATGEDLIKGAKDAWNQQGPVEKITVTAEGGATEVGAGRTLQMYASVEPNTAKDKTVTWSVEPGTGTATIDSNGVLTGGTAGTVTVVATANDGSGVKGTYEITVTGPTYGYAVQFYGYEDGKVVFWPAMGLKAQGAITQGVSHNDDAAGCIHHDSWADIKTNLANDPNYYDACKTNGCTKKVLLDQTAFSSTELGAPVLTSGDGGGALWFGLTANEAKWDYNVTTTPSAPTPTYPETLAKIKANSVLKDLDAEIYLLSKAEIDASRTTNASRIMYASDGRTIHWYTSTVHPTMHNNVGRAWTVRGSFPDRAGTTAGAWYQENVGDSKVWAAFGIAPAFKY